VKLVLDVAEEPVTVVADPTRVSQSPDEFAQQRRKIHAGRRIRDRLASRRWLLRLISVRDTGCGITPEMLERVFDPFEQAGASVAQSGGLGLGLMIARGLVEAQGGSIEARSAGKHTGAEFLVRLPLSGK
jgi:two-component system CheB/CheR fusion protein